MLLASRWSFSQACHRCPCFLRVLPCLKISLNDAAEFLQVHCCLLNLAASPQEALFLGVLRSPPLLREHRLHLQGRNINIRIIKFLKKIQLNQFEISFYSNVSWHLKQSVMLPKLAKFSNLKNTTKISSKCSKRN